MADMIEAKDAKKLLGCDDATLTGYVNNGQLKPQRLGGKLMFSRADVEQLLQQQKDDDGTIVLTGDSDDLSIDLGKVVDDSAETIVTGKKGTDTAAGTESITFGEDLEVVSFDDAANTSEIAYDDKKAANLSFTDSNTAVMTAVDETSVGATTQPVDYQTGANDPARGTGSGSVRVRAARSQRAAVEVQAVHWFWSLCLVLTLLIGVFFIVPYFVIAMYPNGGTDQAKLSNKDRHLGLDDNAWSDMAGAIAGFSVEPNRARFKLNHSGDEYHEMSAHDPQAKWRYQQFRGSKEGATSEERIKDYTFDAKDYDRESPTAKARSGKTYPLKERASAEATQNDHPEKLPNVSGK